MNEIDILGHLIRYGLSLKKMEAQDVISWADKNLNNSTNQEIFLDLSLSSSTNEIIEALHKRIKWNFNSPKVRRLILGYYKKILELDSYSWPTVQNELTVYYSYLEFEDSNHALEDPLYYLIDDLQLRIDGLGSILNMPADLIGILSEFDSYGDFQNLLKRHSISGFSLE